MQSHLKIFKDIGLSLLKALQRRLITMKNHLLYMASQHFESHQVLCLWKRRIKKSLNLSRRKNLKGNNSLLLQIHQDLRKSWQGKKVPDIVRSHAKDKKRGKIQGSVNWKINLKKMRPTSQLLLYMKNNSLWVMMKTMQHPNVQKDFKTSMQWDSLKETKYKMMNGHTIKMKSPK